MTARMKSDVLVRPWSEISGDAPLVGGKNASLGAIDLRARVAWHTRPWRVCSNGRRVSALSKIGRLGAGIPLDVPTDGS